jgi:tripeptidyl-peptidase-1
MRSAVAAVWLAIAVFCAAPTPAASLARVTLESDVVIGAPSRGGAAWRPLRRAPTSRKLSLQVALRRDLAAARALQATVNRVSDPASTEYGRYLTAEDVTRLVAAPAEAAAAVREWLASEGVHGELVLSGDWVVARATIAQAEALLETELWEFVHVRTGRRAVRAKQSYSVPASVEPFVELVGELLRLPRVRRAARVPRDGASGDWPNDCDKQVYGLQCGGWLTPGVVKARYRWSDVPRSTNNSVAVAEFDDEYYDAKDLEMFSQACGIEPAVTVSATVGGNRPSVCEDGCTEALMDIELLGALAPGVPLTTFYTQNYDLLAWLATLSNASSVPLVHSVSYGLDEGNQAGGADYMARVDWEFQKLAARGVTIVVSSGDAGVWGIEGGDKFQPQFPASSPNVLAVGGTDFVGSSVGDETATHWSGGGFSDFFSRPEYQRSAVEGYLGGGVKLPPTTLWNSTGRGYPDVSALSGSTIPYCILLAGAFQAEAGTSASAPVVAALLAKLNDALLNAGKVPLAQARRVRSCD